MKFLIFGIFSKFLLNSFLQVRLRSCVESNLIYEDNVKSQSNSLQIYESIMDYLMHGLSNAWIIYPNLSQIRRINTCRTCDAFQSKILQQATFFARSDFFFSLVSSGLELIRNLFNFNNRKSASREKSRLWKTGLTHTLTVRSSAQLTSVALLELTDHFNRTKHVQALKCSLHEVHPSPPPPPPPPR